MGDELNFQIFFNTRLKERGFTLEKLSKTSGIAIKHLENLSAGNLEGLPATPYFHGYLARLGEILEFNAEEWWEKLKKENVVKTSGALDVLPRNRFSQRSFHRGRWISLGIALLLLFAYIGFRYSQIIGSPKITLTSPIFPILEPLTTTNSELTISGKIENGDSLTINNSSVTINDDGTWQKNITLGAGLNTIEIRAKKFLGGEKVLVERVVYEAPAEIQPDHIPPTPPVPSSIQVPL